MRIVVKIGSSSLIATDGSIQVERISAIVDDIASRRGDGDDVILVSSGAIATGLGLIGRTTRPRDLPSLQAASAVGQGALFAQWSSSFAQRQIVAAQVLLTMHDVAHRAAYLNARNTLLTLLAWGAVPVVNENDTTATDEITFGDNDTLAAQVAVLLNADLLVLLTDTDGLYTAAPSTPGAERIVEVTDRSLLGRIDTAAPGSHWGSGGMRSKVVAAEMASVAGTVAYIAKSDDPSIISRCATGEQVGTRVHAESREGSAFKLWLRYGRPAAGTITVDDGARHALCDRGASLLPVGISSVEGDFEIGSVVAVVDHAGREFGRGVVEYSADELRQMLTEDTGIRGVDEAIHRDQLVIFEPVHAPGP